MFSEFEVKIDQTEKSIIQEALAIPHRYLLVIWLPSDHVGEETESTSPLLNTEPLTTSPHACQ